MAALQKQQRALPPTPTRGLKEMRRSRQTEITVEVDQIITVKRRQRVELDWCAACEAAVLMVTADEATAISGLSTREIFRLLDGGEIHFAESNEGLIRLCLPSLLAVLNALRPVIRNQ